MKTLMSLLAIVIGRKISAWEHNIIVARAHEIAESNPTLRHAGMVDGLRYHVWCAASEFRLGLLVNEVDTQYDELAERFAAPVTKAEDREFSLRPKRAEGKGQIRHHLTIRQARRQKAALREVAA